MIIERRSDAIVCKDCRTRPGKYLLKEKGKEMIKGIKHIDELLILGKTKISEIKNGKIKTYYLFAKEVGLKNGKYSDIAQHKTNQENSLHLVKILLGKSNRSSIEIAALNAGAFLYILWKRKDTKRWCRQGSKIYLFWKSNKTTGKTDYNLQGKSKKLEKYSRTAIMKNGKDN